MEVVLGRRRGDVRWSRDAYCEESAEESGKRGFLRLWGLGCRDGGGRLGWGGG